MMSSFCRSVGPLDALNLSPNHIGLQADVLHDCVDEVGDIKPVQRIFLDDQDSGGVLDAAALAADLVQDNPADEHSESTVDLRRHSGIGAVQQRCCPDRAHLQRLSHNHVGFLTKEVKTRS